MLSAHGPGARAGQIAVTRPGRWRRSHSQSLATFASIFWGSANVLRACPRDAPALPSSDDQRESTCPASSTAKTQQATQKIDTSARQGCIKRDGSLVAEDRQNRRQLRRTTSRTKRDGRAQRRDDSGGQAQSRHQGRAEEPQQTHAQGHLQRRIKTVWDTLLVKASSPEADSMQKQMQRQEGRGHTRGRQVSSAEGQHGRHGTRPYRLLLGSTGTLSAEPNLRRGPILQAGQNVRSGHQENHAEHRVARETILLVLEALGRTEAERKYGRAPPTIMEREPQGFLEDLLEGIPR